MESITKDFKLNKGYILNSTSILKRSTIDDKVLVYEGIRYNQFLICGFVVKYEETDKKTSVTIWDSTGVIEVSFFNQNESEKHFGLLTYNYKYKSPAMVFAKVNIKETDKKPLLFYTGVKIAKTSIEEFLYHKMNTLLCWGKLTGLVPSDVEDSKPAAVVDLSNIKRKEENKLNLISIIEIIEKKKGSCTVNDIIRETGEDKHKIEKEINDLIELSAIYIDQGVINII